MKTIWPWGIGMLCVYALLSVGSSWQESTTYDEPLHILAGVAAWKTGQRDLDYGNPPLAAYWETLPLLPLRFHPFPPARPLRQSMYTTSFNFVHRNQYSVEWMLQAPRMMNVILGVLLGLVLFRWTVQALGCLAAKAALCAYAFCPALLGYGHLVKSDIGGTFGWILVFFAIWRWSRTPSPARAALVGLAVGLSLCLKYSTLLILPAVAGTLVFDTQSRRIIAAHRADALRGTLTAVLFANFVMMACYRGWGFPDWLGDLSTIPALLKEGHVSYYFGRVSDHGWKSYYVAAFLLKTPLAFLAVLGWGALMWRQLPLEQRRFLLPWCLWPSLFLFLASSQWHFQVGLRHILPVYPFSCLGIGSIIAAAWDSGRRLSRWAVIFLGTWYTVGTAAAFPRYISYFNEIMTPSSNAYHYFADANLDWGQGLKALGTYLEKRGSPTIYLSYFGCADPEHFGIRFLPVLMTTCTDLRGPAIPPSQADPVYFAVSATNRAGLFYTPQNAFGWLDHRKPVKIFMDSIWLYDFQNDPEARARLHYLSSQQ